MPYMRKDIYSLTCYIAWYMHLLYSIRYVLYSKMLYMRGAI